MQSVILGSQGAQEAAILNPMSTIQDAQRRMRNARRDQRSRLYAQRPSAICHLPSET